MRRERQEREAPVVHPGYRIDKIPVEGPVGLLFTIATLFIFLTGVPETRIFLAVSLPAGIVVAILLRLVHHE